MKRLHVNLKVTDLKANIHFYSQLFGQQPSVVKPDYAKWSLNSPSVNFALSQSDEEGLNHLGIEVTQEEELQELFSTIQTIEGEKFEEGHTVCCYAKSEKGWIKDPQAIEWEIFRTYGNAEFNSLDSLKSACCV